MNYMADVAQMLGVEIGEEFNIEGGSKDAKYKFSKDYLIMEIPDVGWTRASFYLADLLNGKLKIVKLPKPILTEKEKEYLAYVIKPFRDKIKDIHKYECGDYGDGEGECERIAGTTSKGYFEFPAFKKGTMYKGMYPKMEYTSEELGL